MRSTLSILVVSGALIGLLIAANRAAPPTGTALRLRELNRYVRITEKAYEMHDSTIVYCKQTDEVALNPHEPARPEITSHANTSNLSQRGRSFPRKPSKQWHYR